MIYPLNIKKGGVKMAYRNYKRKSGYRAKSSQYTESEKLAYKLGCI